VSIFVNDAGYAEYTIRRATMKMKVISGLLLMAVLSACASAKATADGNPGGLVASGIWEESREGVGLFCVHVANLVEVARGPSEASCFLTEVQATGKDSPEVRTNVLAVQAWDSHGLIAITTVYTNKSGDPATAQDPNAVKFTFKVVVDFDAHSVTKYVETPAKSLSYHLK
jgi:hypothetical protein